MSVEAPERPVGDISFSISPEANPATRFDDERIQVIFGELIDDLYAHSADVAESFTFNGNSPSSGEGEIDLQAKRIQELWIQRFELLTTLSNLSVKETREAMESPALYVQALVDSILYKDSRAVRGELHRQDSGSSFTDYSGILDREFDDASDETYTMPAAIFSRHYSQNQSGNFIADRRQIIAYLPGEHQYPVTVSVQRDRQNKSMLTITRPVYDPHTSTHRREMIEPETPEWYATLQAVLLDVETGYSQRETARDAEAKKAMNDWLHHDEYAALTRPTGPLV